MRCPLPFGIADAPAVANGGGIFVFGGYGASPREVRNSVLQYSPESDSWSSKSPLPKARWGAAATVYNNNIYVFGGCPNTKAVEVYDLVDDCWSTLRSLPRQLRSQGLMAAKIESEMYVFNEYNAFEYDPTRDRYSIRSRSPVGRRWGTCASVEVHGEKRIYIIGGFDSATADATDANYYYDPSVDRWVGPLSSAPYKAYGVTRDNPVWNNKIYYGFGHSNPTLFFSDMHSYDPVTDTWTAAAKAACERDGVGCAILDGRLYVIGGRNEPNDEAAFGLRCNEQLELPLQ
jgi:N-acetylneuraminic acid mutarotase